MNCKPGDLAIIINGLNNGKKHVGKIIRVTRIHWLYSDCWEYEGQPMTGDDGRIVACIEDCCLRPIRDPGDDAVDETLQRIGKPSRDEVPA